MQKHPSVDDIVVIKTGGEWQTKSGGTLSVLYKIDYSTLTKFLQYDQLELSKLPTDIRGLRSYKVENIPADSIGANEWHRVRTEIVFALKGSFRWTCTDTYGKTREYVLRAGNAILTPHHILHTYVALEDNSTICSVANTLFFPEVPESHDTYPVAEFLGLSNLGSNQ